MALTNMRFKDQNWSHFGRGPKKTWRRRGEEEKREEEKRKKKKRRRGKEIKQKGMETEHKYGSMEF